MILTITPNPTLDRVVFVRGFRLGAVVRAEREALGPSGKGVDASLVLHALGRPTLASGVLAGAQGRALAALLDARGIPHDFVWAEGETRHALVLVDLAAQAQSTISAPTLRAHERHLAELLEVMGRHLPAARYAILAGSLPSGWPAGAYAPMIARCRAAGVPVLLDTSGQALAGGLAGTAPPDVVKINAAELAELVALADLSVEAAARAAAQLREQLNNQAVIVTLGEQGAVAAAEGELWHAQPPLVTALNTAGAGDALAGCVAWARAEGMAWPAALRLGSAAAAAVVTTAGTAECDRATVELLHERVRVNTLLG